MPFQENHSVGTKKGCNTVVASHVTDFKAPKAKIHSLEAMHQDAGSPGFLGTVDKSVCMRAFFSRSGSKSFIRFPKVSVIARKVKNTRLEEKRLHRLQSSSIHIVSLGLLGHNFSGCQ